MEGQGAPEAGICGACGLCCDGSLFGHVPIRGEDEPRARRALLPLVDRGGALTLAQPCAAHRGDHCAVYAERPEACVGYRCTLLRRYEAGEVGREEALARIATARALVTALSALAGVGGDEGIPSLWSAVEARIAADGVGADTLAWRRAHQALLLESAAVATFLRRHFKPDFRQRPTEPLGEHRSGDDDA